MAKRGRIAPVICLTKEERRQLESYVRSRSIPSGLSTRFRIILLAADGLMNKEISEKVGLSRIAVGASDTRKRALKVCMMNSVQAALALFRTKRWLN
jgi:DNA-binding NarL/FixJ family response regulator